LFLLTITVTGGFIRNPQLYTVVKPMKCYKCSI
jgi:hypothetical protein